MNKLLIVILIIVGIHWIYTDRVHTVAIHDTDIEFDYIVKLTGNSGSADELPLLIALHGNGDTPSNFFDSALDTLTIPARVILIKGPFDRARGSSWPWSAEDFKQYGQPLSEAISILTHKYPTTGKPALLGFSGGGMMAYYQAINHGNIYSSVFPVSGRISNELLGGEAARPGAPVYIYHGKSDGVMSFAGGKNAANLLRGKGISVRFNEFDGGHLGIFKGSKSHIVNDIEDKLTRA